MRSVIIAIVAAFLFNACTTQSPGSSSPPVKSFLSLCEFSKVAPEGAKILNPIEETFPATEPQHLYNRYKYVAQIILSEGKSIEDYVVQLVHNVERDIQSLGFRSQTITNEPNIYFVKYENGPLSGTAFVMAKRLEGNEYELTFNVNETPMRKD